MRHDGRSKKFRTIPTNLFSKRFSSAAEHPGSNTNRSEKYESANDTSNNGTDIW